MVTIDKITDVIDGGEFGVRSHPMAIPEGINAIGMHRIPWPQMGPFIGGKAGANAIEEADGHRLAIQLLDPKFEQAKMKLPSGFELRPAAVPTLGTLRPETHPAMALGQASYAGPACVMGSEEPHVPPACSAIFASVTRRR